MNERTYQAICWRGGIDGHLVLLDQTRLPVDLQYIECRNIEALGEAIRALCVRGAPAIGIAAAYGTLLGLNQPSLLTREALLRRLDECVEYLASSRPTAVNLGWALRRMQQCAHQLPFSNPAELRQSLLQEAVRIHDEDRATCHAIGRHGAVLLSDNPSVLTHCNTGGLATSEYGTALSILFTAQDLKNTPHVFVDETRPLLQGARLTAWELAQRGIPVTLICDSMAAQVMKERRVDVVITGADRIAANGDAANKIGTYGLAVLARHHGIPFYVAAPSNTFDLNIDSGASIPIEQRSPLEITHGFGKQTAPGGIDTYNPAFDVTPAELITAIITEFGVIEPVDRDEITRVFRQPRPVLAP